MAFLGSLEQEASQDSKGHQESLVRKDPKVNWETEAPEGLLHEDLKVSQDLPDFLVSQANLAMVGMVGMGRGVPLVFLDSPVYLGLQVQLVPTVTATRQRATSRQGLPTSLWM